MILTKAATERLRRDREVFETVATSVHLEKMTLNSKIVEGKKRKNIRQKKESKVLMLATMNQPVWRETTFPTSAEATG